MVEKFYRIARTIAVRKATGKTTALPVAQPPFRMESRRLFQCERNSEVDGVICKGSIALCIHAG